MYSEDKNNNEYFYEVFYLQTYTHNSEFNYNCSLVTSSLARYQAIIVA